MFSVRAFEMDGGFSLPLDSSTATTLAGALREGFRLITGVPCAECCIHRYGPDLVAYLETNWRGELKEAEVYSCNSLASTFRRVPTLVTPLNPTGPLFRR
jgi:hypothetical protein